MDEIYTDLDNFNDVNLVEELKSENKDLKFKLEEYSSALDRLQKDFDKLSGEFKNLEKNYSSLLKTARAEIQRKTDTIKNLNIEKDQLVINSMQKGKNILHNHRSNFKDSTQNNKEKTDKAENLLQTNKDKGGKHKTNKNENIQETQYVKKIVDRRKSINLMEPTFSSDEDSRKTISEHQYPLKDVRQNEKRYDQQDHVTAQPFEYHQPSSYRNRSSRYNEFERQRNYDHYESYDKSRRYYSPDNHYRYGKDQSESYIQRDYRESKRDKRIERSPATDRYSRAKSRDRRSNYERDNYYDQGRNSHHNNDHLPIKTRAPLELEQPNSKRLKIDTYTRHTNENIFDKEREFVERHIYANTQNLKDPSTCQSPDYTHIESNVHHSVKEIIHTALTPLQDPRLLSDKYILISNSDKPILMTVAGSDVEMVPITNPAWGEDKKPSKQKDVNIHLDMDIQNASMESGEIHSIHEDLPVNTFPSISELKSEKAKNSNSIVDTNTQTTAKEGVKSYKIPRIQKSGEVKKTNILLEQHDESRKLEEIGKDFRVIVEGKHLSEKSPENLKNTNNIKMNATKTRNNSKSILQKLIDETDLSDSFDNTKIPVTSKAVNISTVEGDLELSDETSDNMDLIKEDTSENKTKPESTDDLSNKKIYLDSKTDEANKSDNKVKRTRDSRKSTHLRKDSAKEKVRESTKKRRTKKQKDQECNVLKDKSPPAKENIEKESKPNISSQTKTKFTDLFGDSNSLITPDDLGLPAASPICSRKFEPIFENTQDAVDLSVEDINMVKAAKVVEHTKADEIDKEEIIQDTAPVINKNGNCDDREHKYNKSATVSNDDTKTKNDINQPSLIFEKEKSDDSSNVVKTIIISTGTQPQCILQDKDVSHVENIIQKQSDLQKGTFTTITAIATSTPCKLDSTQKSLAIDPAVVSKDKLDQINATSYTIIGLNTTESIIQNDSDVPDVRIFVKRRKKIAKKPA